MTCLVAKLREVQSHEVDDSGELIVHDAAGQQLLVLNPVAAAIFELIDGECDLEQMVSILCESVASERNALRRDVELFLRELASRGIAELIEPA